MASKDHFRYSYEIDLDTDTTASRVLHLVGHGKRVLECGCGPGHMTRVLVEHFRCEVTGIEIDKEAAREAETFCQRVICGDLDVLNLEECLEGHKFDVVVFADVLEHLKDPGRSLRQAHKILAPEGYVVISVPNIAYAGLMADLLQGRFRYREKGLLDATHLRFFTAETLKDMLEDTGYSVEVWDRYRVVPEHTEFGDSLQQIPPTVRDFLLQGHEALTYQFIVKALPGSPEGRALDCKTGNVLKDETPSPIHSSLSEDAVEQLRKEIKELEKALSQIQTSKSWKITAPLRTIGRWLTYWSR